MENLQVFGSAFNESTRHTLGFDGPITVNEVRDIVVGQLTWEYEDLPASECDWYVEYNDKAYAFEDHASFQQFLAEVLASEGELLHNG